MTKICRENDEIYRKKEQPHLFYNNTVTTLVPMEFNEKNQVITQELYEPEAKTQVIMKEYTEDSDGETNIQVRDSNVHLNFMEKKQQNFVNVQFNIDEEENPNDPYLKKKKHQEIKIDEETERMIKEISNEVNLERKMEEKRKIQKEHL